MNVVTEHGAYELTRVAKEGGALEGWAMGGAVMRLILVEGRDPFLKRGVVLQQGDRLWVDPVDYRPTEQELNTPGFSKIRDLGRVGAIMYQAAQKTASDSEASFVPAAAPAHS